MFRKILLIIAFVVVSKVAIAQATDEYANSLIKAEIAEAAADLDELNEDIKLAGNLSDVLEGGEEELDDVMAAHDAMVAHLQALLESKDTELKRLYLISLNLFNLEYEKGTLGYLEKYGELSEKNEALAKIGQLKADLAKLKSK